MIDQNLITVHAFSKEEFVKAVIEASRGEGDGKPPDQVNYLARYCHGLESCTFVREDVYIDRHYMDEFASYYSRVLLNPGHAVRRFHLFSSKFDEATFTEWLKESLRSPEDFHRIQKMLNAAYLGFTAIRPLPMAPVGRTVLKRWSDKEGRQRDIWATANYDVHLAGLKLSVEGLAFQQQDIAVGACATTALWSALSRVTRHEGMRAPTPAEVSEAAARRLMPVGRTVPADSGLTMEQLCEAVRVSGFEPEFFRVGARPEIFVAGLHSYLLSGIPVVLSLWNPQEDVGHAVTAVGFQAISEANPLLHTVVNLRSAQVRKLYVHDDQIGPYASVELSVVQVPNPKAPQHVMHALMLTLDGGGWIIESAVAPIYPKLRLSFRSLMSLTNVIGGLMEEVVGQERAVELVAECQFLRAGDYLSRLPGRTVGTGASFLRTVLLPRWCAVSRWFLGTTPVAEFVFDTTDILRDPNGRDWTHLLRAIVALDEGVALRLREVAETVSIPHLT